MKLSDSEKSAAERLGSPTEPSSPTRDGARQRKGPAQSRAKRCFDVLIASAAFIFVLPLMVVVSTLLTLEGSPVLVTVRRAGLGGKVIGVLMFRTHDSHPAEGGSKPLRDPGARVPSSGPFLRRSSIDKLPMLFNVLRGELSIVGPQAHDPLRAKYYTGLSPLYPERLRAKPGITGLAQLSGLGRGAPSIDLVAHQVDADNEYIDHWSLWLDVKILVRTVLMGPFREASH